MTPKPEPSAPCPTPAWGAKKAQPTPPASPARDEVIELLASKFPITFTTFGNGKTPNALAANVADVVLAALSRSSTVTAPVIGGTAWCGHGVMASICPQCAAAAFLDHQERCAAPRSSTVTKEPGCGTPGCTDPNCNYGTERDRPAYCATADAICHHPACTCVDLIGTDGARR